MLYFTLVVRKAMKIMDYISLGQRIKKERLVRGLTQEKLAEMVGVSTNFISQIERGKSKMSVQNFAALAEALGTSADSLLGNFGDVSGVRRPGLAGELLELLSKMTVSQRLFVLNHAKQFLDIVSE